MSNTYFIAKKFINYQSKKSFAFKLRAKRAERLKQLITEYFIKYGKVNIIDIGGTKLYWNIIPESFLIENKVKIALVNLPSNQPLPENDDIFSFHNGDGCNLTNFTDKSFHIAHSNSVIEHVGNDENRIKFANEIKRVAETYYLQTPNFWFPVEPHFVTPFFHWLPVSVRIWLLLHFNLGWFLKATDKKQAQSHIDGHRLLSKRELLALFPNTVLHREWFILFIKSFTVIGKNN
ncbi:MAG: class I SAM-dependent methyltransferase [Tannerellaceae bacterium]|jgi:hypothetical protein|nr:class I SAM-dependent methyltransferase [Tannerellaceae bacterium]